jgi:hypothetical protein
MDAEKPTAAAGTCPRCGSPDYQFRSRRKVPADPEKGEIVGWETKYRYYWNARARLPWN